jgi:hypothetical protein
MTRILAGVDPVRPRAFLVADALSSGGGQGDKIVLVGDRCAVAVCGIADVVELLDWMAHLEAGHPAPLFPTGESLLDGLRLVAPRFMQARTRLILRDAVRRGAEDEQKDKIATANTEGTVLVILEFQQGEPTLFSAAIRGPLYSEDPKEIGAALQGVELAARQRGTLYQFGHNAPLASRSPLETECFDDLDSLLDGMDQLIRQDAQSAPKHIGSPGAAVTIDAAVFRYRSFFVMHAPMNPLEVMLDEYLKDLERRSF